MSFPAYPVYKNSGVDWLGEIPEGWSIKPLWALFRRHKLTGFPDEQLLSVYRDYGVIPKASRDDNFNKPSDDLGAYQLVQIGDLAINKMKAWQGSVGISSHKGIVSPAYHVYAPSHSEASQYLHHLFRCNEYIAGYLANSKGIRVNQWDLEPQQHSRMSVLLPSFQEQTQIARFLDHETARIDALIEEQQRLIELLKEKRQAVISHAVTKGLDPAVPMKDSGVEWLGEVPAHWSSIQVGRVCRKVSDGPHFSPDYVDEGVMFLSARNIAVDGWHLDDAKFVSEEDYLEFCRRIVPEKGDVLYTKGGTTGIARVVDLDDRFQVWVHVAVLKLDRELVDPYYMAFALNSTGCYEQSQLHTRGATNQDLGLTRMIKIWFALPPREEQIRICEFLTQALSKIDDLIAEASTVTSLLSERRSALISAAVTGKIDVRSWQPPASAFSPELAQEAV
ncbi:restriction endonuclease subunit S [Pseudomonas sp. CNPSo 3701]|uniref:restriction endonuclease subunit S n=1 Tax=Pseudomonas sp. CNPSo 3701 TaxID=3027943 RepID=UPI0023636A73|nr:restriction endonuclease subunit S [Pseudomonas sp. CNPSo 3701]MDD1508129.1 restriction endonuclease subunit S [Pseudomonas sp. CNPSo 3701]